MPRRPIFRTYVTALLAAAALVAITGCGGVKAGGEATSDYPEKAVELTIPMTAGGSTDILGRAVGKGLADELGQPVPVVNRPGAAGAVGTKGVLGKPADGYAIAISPSNLFTIQPMYVSEADQVKLDDLTVIGGTARGDFVLVSNADTELKTAADLLKAGRRINYGTAGVGSGSQLSQALLFGKAGTDATDVPFEGNAPNITALLGKQIDVASLQIAEAMPHIKSGKFIPLLMFGKVRSKFLPDTPTATELGHGVVVDSRFVVNGPAGLPEATVKRLQDALAKTYATAEYEQFLNQNYFSRDEVFGEQMKNELIEALGGYQKAVQELGLKTRSK